MNRETYPQSKTEKGVERVLLLMLPLFILFLVFLTVVLMVRVPAVADEPVPQTTVDANEGGNSPSEPPSPEEQPPTFVRDPNKKYVAITYDDGPHITYTQKIVDELSKYGYRATFFVIGDRVDGGTYNGAAAMKYAADAGMEIAIHGYTHEVNYSNCTEDEYRRELSFTEDAIVEVLPDYDVKLMRPYYGAITDERIESCPYAVIQWSIDSEDWKHKNDATPAAIVENVMPKVEDGSIILMHDIYGNTYQATKLILEQLHEQGYEVITVSELLSGRLQAGVEYYK